MKQRLFASVLAGAMTACGGGGGGGSVDSFDDAALQEFENATLGLAAMIAYGNALKHLNDALIPALAQVRVGEPRRVSCGLFFGTGAQVTVTDTDNSDSLSAGDGVALELNGCDGAGGNFPYLAEARPPSFYFAEVTGTWTGTIETAGSGQFGNDYSVLLSTSDTIIDIEERPGGSSETAELSRLTVNGDLRVRTEFDPEDRDPLTVAPGVQLFVDPGRTLTIGEGELLLTAPLLRMINRFDGAQSRVETMLRGQLNDFGVGRVEIDDGPQFGDSPQFINNDRAEITTLENFEGIVGPHFASLSGRSPTANLFVALDSGEQGTLDLPWSDLSNQWFSSNLFGFAIHSAAPRREPVTTLRGQERLRVLFTRSPSPGSLPMSMVGQDPNDETAPPHTVNLVAFPGQTLIEWEATTALNPGYEYTLDLSAVTSVNNEPLNDDRIYGRTITVTVTVND